MIGLWQPSRGGDKVSLVMASMVDMDMAGPRYRVVTVLSPFKHIQYFAGSDEGCCWGGLQSKLWSSVRCMGYS